MKTLLLVRHAYFDSEPDRFVLENHSVTPPEFDKSLLAQAFPYRSLSKIITPPSKLEFESNSEMLAKLNDHLSIIPFCEVLYLRKVLLGYVPVDTGSLGYEETSNIWRLPKYDYDYAYESEDTDKKIRKLITSTKSLSLNVQIHRWIDSLSKLFTKTKPNEPQEQLVAYCGEAWAVRLRITGWNLPIKLYFATPDQYLAMVKEHGRARRQKYIPWSDFQFITSSICQNNFDSGEYFQYLPEVQRLGLSNWLVG